MSRSVRKTLFLQKKVQDITKNNFDFIRVLLAFIVLLGHLGILSEAPQLAFLKHSPVEIAVYSFFIISGFLIARSYERTRTLKRYAKKRINRIFPGYFLVVFLSAIMLSLVSIYSFTDYFSSPRLYKYLFWNSCFLNYKAAILPGVFHHSAVNGALWTIKIELLFYAVVPVLFLFFGKNNTYRNASLIAFYFLSLAYLNYFLYIGNPAIARQIPGSLCFFIGGMLIYFNFEKFIKYKHQLFAIAIVTIWIDLIFKISFFSPIMLSIIVLYITYSFKFLNNFGKYGDFTYGIYIFHFPIIRVFATLGLFATYNPFFVSFLCLLVVIAIGAMSWHFYEKKFL